MKKRLSAIWGLVLGAFCISVPFTANAEVDFFKVENDKFTYEFHHFSNIDEELTVPDGERLVMVTAVYTRKGETQPYSYMLRGINEISTALMDADMIAPFIDGEELHMGDVLNLKCNWGVRYTEPAKYERLDYGYATKSEDGIYTPNVEYTPEAEYVGVGSDIFGDEFMRVVKHELALNICNYPSVNYAEVDDTLITKGDATEDDTISIVDVLAVNQSLLGIRTLSNYGVLASDVNHNDTVEDADAMKILKSLVGLETLE